MASEARFIRADRLQTRWDFVDLEALLPSDHRARAVMGFVEGLDLSALYAAIKAREGEPGRPPPDPAVLMALWLYATIEGVGSARQLERLTQSDLAYRWIAGGVP
jgi:transposase